LATYQGGWNAIEILTYWRTTMFRERPAQLVAIMDVTAKRQAEARIAHMVHHDVLTGLPNRVLFHERLDEALSRVRRDRETGLQRNAGLFVQLADPRERIRAATGGRLVNIF
jgi:predicted signal transduction protein with EAL and GGDEF domain